MTTRYPRLLEYSNWANQRILGVLHERDVTAKHVLSLLAHLLAAEQVWLARLRGAGSAALEIWPVLSLSDCASLANENFSGYREYFATTSRDEDAEIVYRNSKDATFRSRIEDVLIHVAMHGSYHRGQIAHTLRELSIEPCNTDYITFSREGF